MAKNFFLIDKKLVLEFPNATKPTKLFCLVNSLYTFYDVLEKCWGVFSPHF